MTTTTRRTGEAIGASIERLDGPEKVLGTARYAYEYPVEGAAYVAAVLSSIPKGRIVSIDWSAARALPGVLAVLSHENAPELDPPNQDLAVFQSDAVAYNGQFVAAVVAETSEIARHAASLVEVAYDEEPHDVDLNPDRGDLVTPPQVMGGFETDTESGDVEAALGSAAVVVDRVYTTPHEHNNPIETHATVAIWDDDGAGVTLYDADQGPHGIRSEVARAFGLELERVRVISKFVGGAFGSKAFTHPHQILAVMAAREAERPVKLELTRKEMFTIVGHRPPTIQRVRLGADREGRLSAVSHEVAEQTSTLQDYAEQTAVPSRTMYAAPHRRTTHRIARLDLPTPTIMRAPGECPGMFALESAMDELAIECGVDPIKLRILNEPTLDPETGNPYSSRNVIACLKEGARRFGWEGRDPTPRARRDGRYLVGTGVAASTYPTGRSPAEARIRVDPEGFYTVSIDASDIGTGTWTALTQIAADALDAPIERVRIDIGDSALPQAPSAGGSRGLASWGSAVVVAARNLRSRLERELGGEVPVGGTEANGSVGGPPEDSERFAMHAFGAQFAEVRVDIDTGEVRVPRMVGVFAAGRIVNAKTGHSQLLGGMTMGLSMALEEETVVDERFGLYANHNLAEYHVAVNADVGEMDVSWIDEHDPRVNPMGAKGIGEIGIVGTAAAVANAVHHATGMRVRDLPIRPDKLLR